MTGLLDGVLQGLVPAHVLALVSVALLAGRARFRESSGFVAAFAVGLAAGLGALAAGAGETPAADVLMVAAVLSGFAAAAALRLPAGPAEVLAFIVGLAAGLDSPPDAISLREAILGLIGTACGGIAALAIMVALSAAVAPIWNGIALRVAGSWIAAIALLVLALRWAS
jgi:urease accessory protein